MENISTTYSSPVRSPSGNDTSNAQSASTDTAGDMQAPSKYTIDRPDILASLKETGPFQDPRYTRPRLALLGESILRSTMTKIMFQQTPPIDARIMKSRCDDLMCTAALTYWCKEYQVRNYLGISQDEGSSDTYYSARLFLSFVGGVSVGLGPQQGQVWVNTLMNDPKVDQVISESKNKIPNPGRSGGYTSPSPPRKRQKTAVDNEDSTTFDTSAPFIPISHATLAPQGPSTSSVWDHVRASDSPTAEHTLMMTSTGFLAHLNQVSVNLRKTLHWHMSSTGPPHQLEWFASVSVDGKTVGSGKGNTKQAAKEAAAQEGCHTLNWAVLKTK